MAGFGFDADQNRAVAGLRFLKLRREFEAVSWDDSVVGISGGDQGRRVADSVFDVVVGRVGSQDFEFFFVVR